jgi:hypothetical protein
LGKEFLADLSHRKAKWDNLRSSFELRHRRIGEARTLRFLGVPFDLIK